MNYLDIVLLGVLVISFVVGARKGLINAVFSLVGVIIGIWLAGRYYTSFSNSAVEQAITFIVILIAVAVAVTLAGRLVSKIVHLSLLGWLDALLGGILGIVFAALVIGLVLVVYLRFIGPSEVITGSGLARVLVDRIPLVMSLLPEKLRQVITPYFR